MINRSRMRDVGIPVLTMKNWIAPLLQGFT